MQALRILVVVMGVMIVVGVAVIAVTIAKRSGLATPEPTVATTMREEAYGDVDVALRPGEIVADELAADGRLVLKVRHEDTSVRYIVIDIANGQILGTIRPGTATPGQ